MTAGRFEQWLGDIGRPQRNELRTTSPSSSPDDDGRLTASQDGAKPPEACR